MYTQSPSFVAVILYLADPFLKEWFRRDTTLEDAPQSDRNAYMDNNQARIVDLLREVHLIAFKEIERLNLRIAELGNQHRGPTESSFAKPPSSEPISARTQPQAAVLTERQVADYLDMSVASLRRWRLFRTGPKFVKIGTAVRYKRGDIEMWLDSCYALP